MPGATSIKQLQDLESQANNAQISQAKQLKLGDINIDEEESIQMQQLENDLQLELQTGKFEQIQAKSKSAHPQLTTQ